jgi:cell division protein FtsB
VRAVYEDYDEPHEDWLRGLLNRILYLLVFAAVVILFVCWFLPLIREEQKEQRALQAFKDQVAHERALLNKQSKKLNLLQNDRSYIEMLARDKLDLMKPGETIFRMEPISPDK